jgi:RNA polymerase sigma-70 factor (ECF subfamily)
VTEIEPGVLEKAQKGDLEAFTYLVDLYQKPVYNLCYRMLGNAEEAEDAAQETFMRIYKGFKRYDPKRSFSTWVMSIAAHYCIDQLRKRRLTILSMNAEPHINPPDTSPGPEEMVSRNEDIKRIRSLLSTLNPTDRAAVILRYWYEFSYVEIANSLSLSVSAVKSRLHRARLALAQTWAEREQSISVKERTCHESPIF